MLCLPGLTPVANDAHAVGDSGECVVVKGRTLPRAASFERLGSCPAFIQRSSSVGSIPSKPRMTSLGRVTSRLDPDRHDADSSPKSSGTIATHAAHLLTRNIDGRL